MTPAAPLGADVNVTRPVELFPPTTVEGVNDTADNAADVAACGVKLRVEENGPKTPAELAARTRHHKGNRRAEPVKSSFATNASVTPLNDASNPSGDIGKSADWVPPGGLVRAPISGTIVVPFASTHAMASCEALTPFSVVDSRAYLPRFTGENRERNQRLLETLQKMVRPVTRTAQRLQARVTRSYAVTPMQSSASNGKILASGPRLISEYSICRSLIGCTARAR